MINYDKMKFSWLYRIRPSVIHNPFKKMAKEKFTNNFSSFEAVPNQFRWHPFPFPDRENVNFIDVGF